MAWAYDELAMYEEAIAAGDPLPEPPKFLIPSARKRSLRSAARERRRAMEHVEMLRTLTRNADLIMLNSRLAGLEVDLAGLRRVVGRARRELDVADSVKEAAQSTSLPGGRVGGRAVARAPVTAEEHTAFEGTIAGEVPELGHLVVEELVTTEGHLL